MLIICVAALKRTLDPADFLSHQLLDVFNLFGRIPGQVEVALLGDEDIVLNAHSHIDVFLLYMVSPAR